jgi:hypothetical protein
MSILVKKSAPREFNIKVQNMATRIKAAPHVPCTMFYRQCTMAGDPHLTLWV